MIIEPITLEPGFFKRFIKNSYSLIWRDITIWLLYIFVSFVLSIGANNLLDLVYQTSSYDISRIFMYGLKIFFGVFVCFWGVEIAANLDYSTMVESGVFKTIKVSAKHTVFYLKENIIYVTVLLAVLEVLRLILFKSAKHVPIDNSNIIDFFIATFGSMVDFVFWGFLIISTARRSFSFPLIRQFSLGSYAEAKLLSQKGFDVNPKLDVFFNMGLPFLIIVSPIFTFFILIPFVYPLVSLLIYMSFREIYLNKTENEKQEVKQQEGKLVLIKN